MKNTTSNKFFRDSDEFRSPSFKKPRFKRSYENRIAKQEIEDAMSCLY